MTWRMRSTGGFILGHTWYAANQFIYLNQLNGAGIASNSSPSLCRATQRYQEFVYSSNFTTG